jgi:hypothetical protein
VNKWLALGVTVLTAVAAGISQAPYPWAHIAVGCLSAVAAVLSGGAGVATVATTRATATASRTDSSGVFWPNHMEGK